MLRVCSPSCVARETHAAYCIVIFGPFVSTTFSHTWHDIQTKLLIMKCVFPYFSTPFFWSISIYKENLALYHKSTYVSITVPIILLCFNETWSFSTDFRKNAHRISWISVQWKQTSPLQRHLQTDRRTDMTKPIITFRNSAKTTGGKITYVSYYKTWV